MRTLNPARASELARRDVVVPLDSYSGVAAMEEAALAECLAITSALHDKLSSAVVQGRQSTRGDLDMLGLTLTLTLLGGDLDMLGWDGGVSYHGLPGLSHFLEKGSATCFAHLAGAPQLPEAPPNPAQ